MIAKLKKMSWLFGWLPLVVIVGLGTAGGGAIMYDATSHVTKIVDFPIGTTLNGSIIPDVPAPIGGVMIRNGNMAINQRGNDLTAAGLVGMGLDSNRSLYTYGNSGAYGGYTASASHIADGWKIYSGNTTTMSDTAAWYSFSTDGSTDTPRLDGYVQATNYLQITNAKAITSLGTDSQMILLQRIESADILPYATQNATVSAWVWCDTPIDLNLSVINAKNTRSFPFSQAVAASTWTRVTKIVPLEDATNYGNGTSSAYGASLMISLAAGSAKIGTAATWNAGAYIGSVENNFCYAAGQKFRITNVKMEPGSVATPFVPRPYSEELARSTRFFERIYADEASCSFGFGATSATTTIAQCHLTYSPKRAAPTSIVLGGSHVFVTQVSGGGARAVSAIYDTYKGKNGARVRLTIDSDVAGAAGIWRGSSATAGTDYVDIISEL
jgi:hypothetical protein